MGKAFEKGKIDSINGGSPQFRTEEEQKSLPNGLAMRVMEESEAGKEESQK